MSAIKTIIFDLGGVLIDWNPKRLFRKIFETEQEIDDFLANVCTMDWNEQQDAGRSLEEATNILLERFPDYEVQIKAYYGRWSEMLGGAIEGTVAILENLKNNGEYQLLALTNWSAETFPIAQERFDFLNYFEDILVSGEVKLKKPDPRIYRMLLENHQLEASSSVFIDDSARNIAAATALGIQSIHFQSPEQVQSDLKRLGINC